MLSVSIRLDYSLDASGFFTTHPEARTVLQSAADTLTQRLADTLAAIQPSGSNTWTLTVTGKPAHSSQIFRPDIGYGAIFEAARILEAFRVALAGEPHLTLNPALMVGGTKVDLDVTQARGSAFGKDNVIPERAIVSGDLRALSKEQFALARKRMEEIVAASLLA